MSIDLLRPTWVDVRYFGSDRFYSSEGYRESVQQKINCEEIVSFDCCLFDMYEIESPDSPLKPGTDQIIAVIIRPGLDPIEYMEKRGFTFCGYDLVDDCCAISAITNCGAEFNSIPYEKLNEYGLLPTYKDAVLTQLALVEDEEDSEDSHAYCDIYEIWRKIV